MNLNEAPPADIGAERAVLGSLFHPIGAGKVGEVLGSLQPDDFYREGHQLIFLAAIATFSGGGAIDAVALKDALKAERNLEKVGGPAYLVELMEAVPTSCNAMYYAKIVRERGIRRRAIRTGSEMLRASYDLGTPIEATVSVASRRCRLMTSQAASMSGDNEIIMPGHDTDIDAMKSLLELQATGEHATIPLPWSRLSTLSKCLRPGTVCVLAGPACTGKSFFTACIAKDIHDTGVKWRYLPLEDTKMDLNWRFLAMLARSYQHIDDEPDGVWIRKRGLQEHGDELASLTEHICENPHAAKRDAAGKIVVDAVPYQKVLEWLEEVCDEVRIVFVDPISQIDFPGAKPWAAEQDFVRQLLGITATSGATAFLVAHTVKRPGKARSLPLSLEDIQGSAMIGRLCQSAILLDAHDPIVSSIYRTGGAREEAQHNRTVLVAKARNAAGTGQRIAFMQDSLSPTFTEIGVIAPKGAKGDDA